MSTIAKLKDGSKGAGAAEPTHLTNVLNLMTGNIPPDIATQLEELRFRASTDGTDVVVQGKKLILPVGMSKTDAVSYLNRKIVEEDTSFDIQETIEAFPFDAARALKLVLEDMYGEPLSEGKEIQTVFGPFKLNCQMIRLEVSKGKYEMIPWGTINIPGVGRITMGFAALNDRTVLSLEATVLGKHRDNLTELLTKVRAKAADLSIFKGQAVKLEFRNYDGERVVMGPDWAPEFVDLTTSPKPIFNERAANEIEVALLNPIRHTDVLRKRDIPVGRRVLLEGEYGNGKTLTAAHLARECVKNNWTFFYCTDVRDIDQTMKIAVNYGPAVVFVEDVDHVILHAENDNEAQLNVQNLSTAFDGVDNKDSEVMLVMTTNNVDAIPKILKRPGRMDAIINIGNPDQDTVVRLVRQYAGQFIDTKFDDASIKKAVEPIIGQSASFVRELVERAKLGSVTNEDGAITPADISTAAGMMAHHAKVLDRADEVPELVTADATDDDLDID